MSGAGICDGVCGKIDVGASRRYELTIQHTVQNAVEAGENGRRIGRVPGLLCKRDF